MHLTPSHHNDLDAIAAIHVACWKEVYPFIGAEVHKQRSLLYRYEQWHSVLSSNKSSECLYSLKNDRDLTVGFCFCRANEDRAIEAKGEMHAAYILPEFRGGATGPQMMLTMASFLHQNKLEPMCLWAFDQNPIGCWYRQLGWQATVHRDRELFGERHAETGYIHPSPNVLMKRLKLLIKRASETPENQQHSQSVAYPDQAALS